MKDNVIGRLAKLGRGEQHAGGLAESTGSSSFAGRWSVAGLSAAVPSYLVLAAQGGDGGAAVAPVPSPARARVTVEEEDPAGPAPVFDCVGLVDPFGPTQVVPQTQEASQPESAGPGDA